MARLVLVGLPGVGKSSVARHLARRWHCDAVDTDDEIAAHVGCPSATYLRREGEASFRREEFEALERVLTKDVVVATGGGVVTTPEARDLLSAQRTVWLDCSDEVLLPRLARGDRPLLGDDPATRLANLRAERSTLYEQVASYRVDASGSLDAVCARVIDALGEVAS